MRELSEAKLAKLAPELHWFEDESHAKKAKMDHYDALIKEILHDIDEKKTGTISKAEFADVMEKTNSKWPKMNR